MRMPGLRGPGNAMNGSKQTGYADKDRMQMESSATLHAWLTVPNSMQQPQCIRKPGAGTRLAGSQRLAAANI